MYKCERMPSGPLSQSIIGPNTLRALALMRPGTAKQLFSVEGMGAERANRYGQAIIDVRGGGGRGGALFSVEGLGAEREGGRGAGESLGRGRG